MLSPMETSPCSDVTYTRDSVGWRPVELCNIGNQNGKVPSSSLSHEGSTTNCLAVWCHLTLSCAPPCLSARLNSFRLPGMSVFHGNIQPRDTLQLLLQVRNEHRVRTFMESTNACWQTVYDNGTIHDFAVVSQMWLWMPRLL